LIQKEVRFYIAADTKPGFSCSMSEDVVRMKPGFKMKEPQSSFQRLAADTKPKLEINYAQKKSVSLCVPPRKVSFGGQPLFE